MSLTSDPLMQLNLRAAHLFTHPRDAAFTAKPRQHLREGCERAVPQLTLLRRMS